MIQGDSRKIRFFVCFWLAAVAAFAGSKESFTIYAQTATVEARVTSVRGAATISGNGRSGVRLNRGTTLASGDEITTGRGASVVIDLTDGSQVVILPNSRVVIGSYKNAANLRELLQITLGRIRVKINHFKGKPNPYRIKSPTASIAVRGTEFTVSVTALGETKVVVTEGAVEVASLRDPANPLLAEPGRNVIVRPNFTIDFFASDAMTKEVGERDKQKQSNGANKDNESEILNSAANVYERTIENIVETGETALPSRFAAFPDAYLDSFENPAYADSFTTAEGRFYLVPSINGARSADDEVRDQFGLKNPRPVDYGFVPEGAVFVPIKKFRAVIGGRFGYVRNGLQSLTVDENSLLNSPPFPVGTNGFSSTTGATSGNLFSGSLMFAKRFGSRDQTSVGFSIERLYSRGNLNETTIQSDAGGLSFNQQIIARSSVNRTRLTFGVKHDFGTMKFGAFYRYGRSSGSDNDISRTFNGIVQPNDFIGAKGTTSEIGFRLRGAFSKRLFYGAEGTLLFGDTRENYTRLVIVNSSERDRTSRATLGFGLGYILNSRTVFSFDVAGGLIGTKQNRTEDLTGNLLENERGRSRFLSLNAAVQRDVWRNIFASASVLSLTNSSVADKTFFPDRFGRITNSDGIFEPNGRAKDFFTDIYSNFGIGYRFKPNFIFQYILTTDYGQTSPRHTFLLRYTFDFGRR